jgi:hypothetical protein
LAAGWSVVSDYVALILVPIYLVFLLRCLRRTPRPGVALTWWVAGLAGPALILGAYNWTCFGSPFTVSYAFNVPFPWTHHFSTTYVSPWWQGLSGLIYGSYDDGKTRHIIGQVAWSPVLLPATAGYVAAVARRESRPGALLALGVMAVVTVLAAKHRTWYGGGTLDARYIYAITPLWFAGLPLWIDGTLCRLPRAGLRHMLWAITIATLILSVVLRGLWGTYVVGAGLALMPLVWPFLMLAQPRELLQLYAFGLGAGAVAGGLIWRSEIRRAALAPPAPPGHTTVEMTQR